MPSKPSKTSREKVASPIRKADVTTAAEEETRLQVIAHYNYTLRFCSCGLYRGCRVTSLHSAYGLRP